MEKKPIKAKIFRFNPLSDRAPRFDEFTLPYDQGVTVLGILRYIFENLDRTLAFRNYHCGARVCGCCRVTLNGKETRACEAIVKPGDTLVIEPYDREKVIRDLACLFD